MESHFGIEIARIITGLLGAYFLFNEVRIAHKVEDKKQKLDDIKKGAKQIEQNLDSGDAKELKSLQLIFNDIQDSDVKAKREFLIRYYCYSMKNEVMARQLFDTMDDNTIVAEFTKYSSDIKLLFDQNEIGNKQLESVLEESNKYMPELERLTSDAKMKSRKFNLYLGFILICLSFGIDAYLQYL